MTARSVALVLVFMTMGALHAQDGAPQNDSIRKDELRADLNFLAGAAMRGEAAELPAETVVSFELRSPVTIQEKKN